MSEHPANHKLEGHAAGDLDSEVTAHMTACDACRTYVVRSMEAARAETTETPAFLRALVSPPSEAIGASRPGRNGAPRVLRLAIVLAPLAAAAALFLFLRTSPPGLPPGIDTPATGIQFKGGLQVAVVRQRGDDQARFASSVGVRPFDHLRVEVALDRERPIAVGVLSDDGAWLPLLAPSLLGPGTHFSERAANVDAHPTAGHLLAGDPEDVERARRTRDFTGVTVLEIVPEP